MKSCVIKTVLKQIFLIICVVLFFVACINQANRKSNVKSEPGSQEETNRDIAVDLKLFVGSWIDVSEAALHFSLFEDGTARSDNMRTLLYKKWRVKKNQIIFTIESIGNGTSFCAEDTSYIQSITKDKMILKKGEFINEYSRKQ